MESEKIFKQHAKQHACLRTLTQSLKKEFSGGNQNGEEVVSWSEKNPIFAHPKSQRDSALGVETAELPRGRGRHNTDIEHV